MSRWGAEAVLSLWCSWGLVPGTLLLKIRFYFLAKDVPSATSNFTNGAIMTVSITLHAQNPVMNFFCLISRHERICCLFGLHQQSHRQLPGCRDIALTSLFREPGFLCCLHCLLRQYRSTCSSSCTHTHKNLGERVNAHCLYGFDSRHLISDFNLAVFLLGSCPQKEIPALTYPFLGAGGVFCSF